MDYRKKERFIQQFAKLAIMHAKKTKEASGQTLSILSYRKKEYSKIMNNLPEINKITCEKNVGVRIMIMDVRKRDVRIFYLE